MYKKKNLITFRLCIFDRAIQLIKHVVLTQCSCYRILNKMIQIDSVIQSQQKIIRLLTIVYTVSKKESVFVHFPSLIFLFYFLRYLIAYSENFLDILIIIQIFVIYKA